MVYLLIKSTLYIKDSQGFIWIGTENGLDRFDGQHFVHFNKNTHSEMTLDRVQFLTEDNEGYLWIVEKNKPFDKYFNQPKIVFYHLKTGKWTTVEERFGQQMASDLKKLAFIKLLKDGSIFLYLNAVGKAYSFQKGTFKKYMLPKELVIVSDVKIKENGDLLITALQNKHPFQRSIFKINPAGQITKKWDTTIPLTLQTNQTKYHLVFNPTTKTTRIANQLPTYSNNFYVYDIQKINAQTVGLSTNQGLYIVNNQGNYIAHYNKKQKDKFYLPTNDIHHLYQEKNGTIWLATGDAGLIQLTMDNGQLTMEKQFTTKNGLSCDILHAVYEDDYEYLWISSNEGLIQFDKQTEKVVNYTTENGLLHNEFNRISHFKAKDGTLYFGGLTGVIYFHPKHFSKVRHEGRQSPLVMTDFQQFSAKKGKFENLTSQLFQTKTIRLQHNDRFFKLNVALLDFKEETTYEYRIKGLYDWQTTKDSELNISGLPYGNHTLEIKGFNKNKNEAANILSFTIHVLKPFYLQWWFLILVLGSLGTAAFYFLKWRTKQLLVFQETKQLRQLDTMKSQFFANISHELRTPITLILAPLAQLIKNHRQQSVEEIDRQLLNIQYNGKSLLTLVNEVLDLSKLEVNKLALDLSPTKIPTFLERIVANFESAAKVKGIEYQFLSFLQKDIVAQFDQAKLEKILNNLLANALKFTSKDGIIQIMVTQIEENLVIKVKDSGKGIAKEDVSYVFDRYFQSKDKQMAGGTGIGLALTKELTELMNGEISVVSELGEGTTFEIKLPIIRVPSSEFRVSSVSDINFNKEESLTLGKFETFVKLNPEENSTDKKQTILLVEDNISLQQFISSVLTPFYNVEIADNGVEALQKLGMRNEELGIKNDEKIPNSQFLI